LFSKAPTHKANFLFDKPQPVRSTPSRQFSFSGAARGNRLAAPPAAAQRIVVKPQLRLPRPSRGPRPFGGQVARPAVMILSSPEHSSSFGHSPTLYRIVRRRKAGIRRKVRLLYLVPI
jgi:hypothetical protein